MFSTGLDLEREGPGGGGKEGGASTSLGPDPLYVYSTAPAHTLGPAAPTQVRIYGSYVGLGQVTIHFLLPTTIQYYFLPILLEFLTQSSPL